MAKIIVIHHAPTIGGGSISFLDILDMIKSEHEVIACCPVNPPDLSYLLDNRCYKHISLTLPIPTFNHYNGGHSILTRTFWLGIANYYKYHKQWEKFIKSYNPDLVIVNSSVMSILGSVINRTGVKSLCFVRETFTNKWYSFRTHIMRLMLNKWFDGVLFISNYDKNFAKLSRPLVNVVRDCIGSNFCRNISRDEACQSLKISEECFNVLYVGGVSWLKGIDVALKSLLYIENENINLIIAGDTNMENTKVNLSTVVRRILNPKVAVFPNKIRKLLNKTKISRKVKVVGIQSDMSYCYCACDVVIFPSNLPHQARPVFESGMYSLPIIISDYRETSEFVEDGVNGITFKHRSEKDLAFAIKKLYYDRIGAKKLGEENYKKSVELHNYEIEKNKLLQFVNSVLDNKD